MTWIMGSIDQSLILNLKLHKTAKDMWEYLKKVYNQDNTAKRSHLEYEIARYSQGNLSIQNYFSGFQNLWAEYVDMIYVQVPIESLADVQEVHEQSKRDQFLMKLRPKYEAARSNLMNRDLSPSLDVCFKELLREEQRLATQTILQQNKMHDNAIAYAAAHWKRQLVDNNCDVRFSRDGCIVRDQVSGKILTKGPKVGRLFPLHFSVSNFVSLASIAVSSTDNQPSNTTVRHSSRIIRPPNRYGFHTSLHTTLTSVSIPSCYSEAAKYDCWHGSLDRYKARLVVLGNKQEYGVNYKETFAPVAKMTTVRTIISIAASQGWPLHQMDVKNAFLHRDLKDEIYMVLPHGLPSSSSLDVCKLKRSLYGLKQAPRAWFDKFRSTLLQFSFKQSQYDSSLFLCKTFTGIVLLLVYVDAIVIIGTDSALIARLQQHLQASFHMKDLGPLTYFLGLEVHYDSSEISLNQHKYTQDLLKLVGLHNASPMDTPLEVNTKYSSKEGKVISNPTIYRQLVGSLNYLTITRSNISFAIQQVSQFMQHPRHLNLVVVHRILRYLRRTPSRGLFFPAGSPPHLVAYSDADWAGCPDSRRSVTGWCMFLGNPLISWKSKKQDRVSKSSTESEYRAMSAGCLEIVWLRGLLAELGFSQSNPTPLHADNTSAIQICVNPVFHERTKHIEVDCHYIREALDTRIISLPHISTTLQRADVFTNAMTQKRHQFLVSKLMLLDRSTSI
ncbi:protein kinase domain-containing protein [Citrus sinensis]|uniref:Protein kinase domain-containing protein n=1 Tax=Citrus sinensis TaxID=2711 RepID=A0ACB8M2M1_CITSI|nr:protein kinase domain-containing protein [Citrus sinensis]